MNTPETQKELLETHTEALELFDALERILALTKRDKYMEVDGDTHGWQPIAAKRIDAIAAEATQALKWHRFYRYQNK